MIPAGRALPVGGAGGEVKEEQGRNRFRRPGLPAYLRARFGPNYGFTRRELTAEEARASTGSAGLTPHEFRPQSEPDRRRDGAG